MWDISPKASLSSSFSHTGGLIFQLMMVVLVAVVTNEIDT